jgi:hypothetical protein
MELGEHDAWRRHDDLRAFFVPSATPAGDAAVP